MADGWIKLYRSLSSHEIWTEEPFTRGQAWVDLLLLANHRPGHIRKRGIRVEVDRGQVGWSEVSLAERWKWSRGKVRRFLLELERKMEQQIVQQKSNATTLISITNYEKYQDHGTASDTADGQQTVQQTDSKRYRNKNEKNEKNEEEERVLQSASLSPSNFSQNGIPARELAEAWNDAVKKNSAVLSQVSKITSNSERYRHLKARWMEWPNMDTWLTVFDKATRSDFLNGRVKKFTASFDWLVKSKDNFMKTLEGNYCDKSQGQAAGMTLEQFKEEYNMDITEMNDLEYWINKGTIRADQRARLMQ